VFGPSEREVVRNRTGADAATWQRAHAWALYFAAMYLGFSADNPAMDAIGVKLSSRLFAPV
ncbi:MAG: phosphotransferase, partial [Actinomycetota bacterium]